jgi:ABC-type nitrate/sulfonate/bicarbonate transport system substrate-binding protein
VTDTRASIPSLVERLRPLDSGAPVVAAHFLGEIAIFVLGEEALLFVPRAGDARRVPIHGGAVLSWAADASRIVTGGDDGKVMATDAEGKSIALATDAKHRWIDHVAVGPTGAIA